MPSPKSSDNRITRSAMPKAIRLWLPRYLTPSLNQMLGKTHWGRNKMKEDAKQATSEEAGIEFSPKSFGACLALGPTKWTDAGYSPAVGPITITLTND